MGRDTQSASTWRSELQGVHKMFEYDAELARRRPEDAGANATMVGKCIEVLYLWQSMDDMGVIDFCSVLK